MFQKNERTEGQMFMLCEAGSLEEIMSCFCGRFGIRNEGSGDTLTLDHEDISIRIQVVTREYEQAGKFLDEQKNGILGHFWNVPAKDTQEQTRKINVLHQIKKTNGYCGVNYSFDKKHADKKRKQIIDMLTGTLTQLRGLLLVPGDGEDVLLDADGKIVLSDQGRSQVKRFMPYVDQALIEMPKEGIADEQIQRRIKSLQVLYAKDVYVPAHYPYIEKLSDAKIRSVEEMADRTVALMAVALYSEAMLGEGMSSVEARAFAEEHVLSRFGGDSVFSPKEKAYFYNDAATEQEKITYSWQYENLYVMEWALGLIQDLPFPDAICDVPLTARVLSSFSDREALLAAAKPRSGEELLDACDLIFCLDWACVDARVYRLPAPAGMDGGITMERHKTLNWLIGCEGWAWDEVEVNT